METIDIATNGRRGRGTPQSDSASSRATAGTPEVYVRSADLGARLQIMIASGSSGRDLDAYGDVYRGHQNAKCGQPRTRLDVEHAKKQTRVPTYGTASCHRSKVASHINRTQQANGTADDPTHESQRDKTQNSLASPLMPK